jgi:4-alpha-glucanotransferase
MQNFERNSGILLHITSLPGREGIGTLGASAFQFIDFLKNASQKLWQILPLGSVGFGNSPYLSYSAFAGNPLLIDLNLLEKENLIHSDKLDEKPKSSSYKVDFPKVKAWKYPLLREAFYTFRGRSAEYKNEYSNFLNEHQWWLNDYALFMAIKKHYKNKRWNDWEEDIKFRQQPALKKYSEMLSEEIEFHKFLQFIFFKQWFNLKNYARLRGIVIFGDLPLYVAGDSADVWSNTDLFMLDENLDQIQMGGVPPDYFSETGQLWGNPVYNWKKLEKRGFDWWLARLHFNLNMFDLVRIDHFRGLEAYWSIPAGEETAINGKWVHAKGSQLLEILKKQIGDLPLIAEDLGVITPEVERLRDNFQLPGMKVLQFAFGSDATNHNLPHNYTPDFFAYTGTHDNNTTLGWFQSLRGEEKKKVHAYLGKSAKKALRKGIEMIWASCARSAVIPMQDLLEMDEHARLNTPGIGSGNWEWRFRWWQLKRRHQKFLKEITEKYNR